MDSSTRFAIRPASFLQERIFATAWDGRDTDVTVWGWWLGGAADIRTVERVVQVIAERHETLRTALREVDGRAVQHVFDRVAIPVETSRSRRVTPRWREIASIAQRAQDAAVDLHNAPWVSLNVLHLGQDDLILLWRLGHTAWDAGSGPVLLNEFQAIHRACSRGNATFQRPLAVQFADLVTRERRRANQPLKADHWVRRLTGASPGLPARHSGSSELPFAYHGLTCPLQPLPPALVLRVNRVARSHSATLSVALLALLAAALHLSSGREDLVLGTFDANRDEPGSELLIGCLVNILLVRATLECGATFARVLQSVRDALFPAYDDKLGIEKQLEYLEPGGLPRDTSRPFCDALLNLTSTPQPIRSTPNAGKRDLAIRPFWPSPRASTSAVAPWHGAELVFNLVLGSDFGLTGQIGYNAYTVEPAVASTLGSVVATLARVVARRPDEPLRVFQRAVARPWSA